MPASHDRAELKPQMPKGLKRVYDALWQEVASAHASWKLFTQLFSHSQERVDLLNAMLPDFSFTVFHALRDSVMVSLCRLTDPPEMAGRKNLCLRRLTLHLKASRFKLLMREIEARTGEAEEYCRPFRKWRNRELAHTDWAEKARYSRQPLPDISKEQFDKALRMTADLLNRVLGYFEDSETDFRGVLFRGDGETLVRYLEEVKEHRNARLRKYLGETGPP